VLDQTWFWLQPRSSTSSIEYQAARADYHTFNLPCRLLTWCSSRQLASRTSSCFPETSRSQSPLAHSTQLPLSRLTRSISTSSTDSFVITPLVDFLLDQLASTTAILRHHLLNGDFISPSHHHHNGAYNFLRPPRRNSQYYLPPGPSQNPTPSPPNSPSSAVSRSTNLAAFSSPAKPSPSKPPLSSTALQPSPSPPYSPVSALSDALAARTLLMSPLSRWAPSGTSTLKLRH
jgi:hypothetical protein